MNKYRNIKTVVDGIKFSSKREAKYYVYLKAMQNNGRVAFKMQVPFVLSPGIKYIADFVEIWAHNGETVVTDCKGFKTAVYRLKKKLMLNNLGIKINEV